MPIVVASVFGTTVAQAVLGHNEALFSIPIELRRYEFVLGEIGPYLLLGVLCGLAGVGFARALYAVEHRAARLRLHPALKPALGGALLGMMGLVFVLSLGRPVPDYEQPAFFANGYPVIEALFNPDSYTAARPPMHAHIPFAYASLGVLAAILVCKFIGTVLTLGSGGSGGIFAPSLFMGAALGGAFGMMLEPLGWFPGMTPATYALAGMAGMLAAAVHCPLTAFLLVFEVTQDYKVILPVMLVAITATTVAQVCVRDSIYSPALRDHGINVGGLTDLMMLHRVRVSQVRLTPAVFARPSDPALKLLELAQNPAVSDFVVIDDAGGYLGLVIGEDLRAALLERDAIPLLVVGDLLRTDPPLVRRDESLDNVLEKFSRHDVSSLPVVAPGTPAPGTSAPGVPGAPGSPGPPDRIIGMISRVRLMHRYQQMLRGV
jgi:CIC family chloride channel protein